MEGAMLPRATLTQTVLTAVDVRYHCLTCDDFDMCSECHKAHGHDHELAKFNDLLDLAVCNWTRSMNFIASV